MNIFVAVGLVICAASIVINRFVCEIPSKIAIPVYIVGIACFVIGFVQLKQVGAI